MAELSRIRTPWKQQWRRMRYQLLPVISMACCVLLTGWLWTRRMTAVSITGEVQIVPVEVTSPVAGTLAILTAPDRPAALYDYVSAGTTVARLDDKAVQLAIATLRSELEQFSRELTAKEEEARITQTGVAQDDSSEARRLLVQVEELRLKIVEFQALIETDRIELRQREALCAMVKQMGPTASRLETLEVEMERDIVNKRLEGNEAALREAQQQLEVAQKRVAEQPRAGSVQIEKLLAPLAAAITVQERKIDELRHQLDSLDIKTPATGRITFIHKYPGQAVQPGDPIVTIVNDQSHYVVAYIRQGQRIRADMGDPVEIRSIQGGQPIQASIDSVGSHVEQIPLHQLRDPKVPEWGVPLLIKIDLPALGQSLRPGDLVQVTLR